MRRKFFMLIALATLIFSVNVEAGVVTDRLPFQCYVDHQVNTYNQPGSSQRAGWISANVDLIRVTYVRADGWAYGDYPGAGGKRVSRWFRITDICADPGYSNRSANVRGSQSVFRTRGSGDTIGSVSNNESVIVLADNGNRAQILYRLDNGTGYKIGWVPSSAVSSVKPNPTPGLKGDVNGDGKVDNRDVELLKNYLYEGIPESQINKANADVDGDGQINLYDVMKLNEMVNDKPQANHNPQGTVEQANSPAPNTLHVRGKAYDLDNARASTRLHVYVGGGAGSGAPSYEIRTDGNSGIFDDTRTVDRTGRQHVYVYALNDYGAGENKEIWNGFVDIQGNSGDYDNKVRNFINDGRYKDGTRWTNCFDYAAAFTKYMFGKAPRQGSIFYSANEIKDGDIIHVNAANGRPQHWIVVLYRNGNRLTTIEGNWTNQSVRYSESAYWIQNGVIYSNNEQPFRAWDCGYHFQ